MGIYSKLNRPIIIAEYDPQWPLLFEQERKRIEAVLGNEAIRFEHIGSTAIPGLAAKAAIDIAIGIQRLEMASKYIPKLESLGYIYEPTFEALLPERRFFWKGTPMVHTYHIHMAEVGSPLWVKPIMFRDYLRRHPDEAQRYSELKKSLAERWVNDMDAYVEGKTDFVEGVLEKAAQEAGYTGVV
ncbi:MAG: GrpB family protein [Nitrospirae bacterium]|nr:GrpB family protein [Nitrospirota bacterium]